MKTLYGVLEEQIKIGFGNSFSPIIEKFGENTEFEAITYIGYDEIESEWSGYLIFKDVRFSPTEKEAQGIQFRYIIDTSASGALAYTHAVNIWETLVGIFKGLMPKTFSSVNPLDDIRKGTLRGHGYEVGSSYINGKSMGWTAKGLLQKNVLRGWYRTEDDAWNACEKDYNERKNNKLQGGF